MSTYEIITFILLSLFISYFIVFRYYQVVYSIGVFATVPMLPVFLLLKFVLQIVVVDKVDKQMSDGRITIWFKILTKLNYWIYSILDEIELTYNNTVNFFGGEFMAIEVQKPGEIETYVPESEDPEDPDRAEFYMKKLRRRKQAQTLDGIAGLSKKGRVEKIKSSEVNLDLVLRKLNGWRGIRDGGNEVEFDPRNKEKCFDMLPVEVQDELLDKFGDNVGRGADQEEGEEEETD